MHHGDESVPSPLWECGTPCPRCQGTPGAMMVAQAVPSWRPHPPVQAQATVVLGDALGPLGAALLVGPPVLRFVVGCHVGGSLLVSLNVDGPRLGGRGSGVVALAGLAVKGRSP